jgi:hypothetical protein
MDGDHQTPKAPVDHIESKAEHVTGEASFVLAGTEWPTCTRLREKKSRRRGQRVEMVSAALDLKTWLWAAMMFSISWVPALAKRFKAVWPNHLCANVTIRVPGGGVSTFEPLIVENFGFDEFQTILLNMPFGAVPLIATMAGAYATTALKVKIPRAGLPQSPAHGGLRDAASSASRSVGQRSAAGRSLPGKFLSGLQANFQGVWYVLRL